MRLKILVIVGCSSSGKDSLLKLLINRGYVVPIVSTTDRPMREGEKQGVEYYFVDKKKTKEMIKNGDFIEVREYHPYIKEVPIQMDFKEEEIWTYGVTKDSFDLNGTMTYAVILDLNGLKQMESYLASNDRLDSLVSVYIDVGLQERLKRSLNREGNMTDEQCLEVARRAMADHKEVEPAKEYVDYVINNEGDISIAFNRILDILEND